MGRVVLLNDPHQLVQRGHNRQIVFTEEEDDEYCLATLREWNQAYGIKYTPMA